MAFEGTLVKLDELKGSLSKIATIQGVVQLGDDGSTLLGNLGVEALRGYSIQYIWDGTNLGIKTEDQLEYQYANLKGSTGVSIDDVWTDNYVLYVRLNNGTVFDLGNIRGETGDCKAISNEEIEEMFNIF